MIECSQCSETATHVLVNYYHEITGDVYCSSHAFEENREECPCCDSYDIEVYDESGDQNVELLPTYPQGTLDNEGCCSEHP